jgi:inositol hexakisphosphate/diphosphoinositol-pentakisphosphate kinase
LTSLPLIKQIVTDLEAVQAAQAAKSFVYFTKESHIYTLLNCIIEGGIPIKMERNAIPELDYLTQISFELYESESKSEPGENEGDPNTSAYSIRIAISPGCHSTDPLDMQLDSKHCIGCNPRKSLTSHLEWKYVVETLREKFHCVKLPNRFIPINLGEAKYRNSAALQPPIVAAAASHVDLEKAGNKRGESGEQNQETQGLSVGKTIEQVTQDEQSQPPSRKAGE